MGETPADPGRTEPAVTGQDLEDVTAALLGRPLDLSRRDVSREAHVSLHSARRFWQALGFPLVNNDELLFTQADVDALGIVAGLVRRGELDEATALQLTRAFARTADRLAVLAGAARRRGAGGRSARPPATSPPTTPRPRRPRRPPSTSSAWPTSSNRSSCMRGAGTSRTRSPACSPTPSRRRPRRASTGTSGSPTSSRSAPWSGSRPSASCPRSSSGSRCSAPTSSRPTAVASSRRSATRSSSPTATPRRPPRRRSTSSRRSPIDELLPDVRVGLAAGRVMPKLGDVFGNTVNRASPPHRHRPPGQRARRRRRWRSRCTTCPGSPRPAATAVPCAVSARSNPSC